MKFKPEDFNCSRSYPPQMQATAVMANIANKKLEAAPVVYGNKLANEDFRWLSEAESFHTHKARIVCIEELPKEPCKHEPFVNIRGELVLAWPAICQHCGVELVAEWKEKK